MNGVIPLTLSYLASFSIMLLGFNHVAGCITSFNRHVSFNCTSPYCLENPMDGGAWWAIVSPWGRKELDTMERLHFHLLHFTGIVFFIN